MRRLALLPIIALAVMPPATAIGTHADLQADGLEWTAPGMAEGRLVALAAIGGDQAPLLELHAERLELEWDETTAYLRAPGAAAVPLLASTHTDDAGESALKATNARPGWATYVLPLGPAVAQAKCGAVAAAQEARREAPVLVKPQRPAPGADTSAAIHVGAGSGCALPSLTVHGDVLLVLWGLDGTLSTPNGTTAFQSGQYDTTAARQYFIRAYGASVAFQSGESDLYLAGLDLSANTLTVRQARGSVAGVELHGAVAVLSGPPLEVAVGRSGSALGLAAERVTRLEIDGSSVALGHPPAPTWPWWLLLILPLATLTYLTRRARDLGRLRGRLDEVARKNDPARIVTLAGRILKRLPNDAPVRGMRAAAWLALGDRGRALEDAESVLRLPLQDRELRGSVALVACRAAALLGHVADALDFLRTAYVDHPSLAAGAAQRYPEVARLLGGPGYS
jgi:hypothetical protein